MNWKRTIITWVIVFGIVYIGSQWFFKQKSPTELDKTPVGVMLGASSYGQNDEVIVKVQNNTDKAITIPLTCPKNPFRVLAWDGSQFIEKNAETQADCTALAPVILEPKKPQTISFAYWSHSLFGTPGRFKIEIPLDLGEKKPQMFSTPAFEVTEQGAFGKTWNTVFYRPLFNLLVLLVKIAPVQDLGFAIIILTILIRLVLLIPSQRAMVAQRRMQELQPKLDAMKKKYAGNQEKIAAETMALWKSEKVNPFGSCLPLLIQFPFLIALYYVIRAGLNPDNSFLLYPSLQNFDFHTIHTNFLGILDLTKVNAMVLPIIVGLLQFGQMKLAMLTKKPATKDGDVPADSEMQQANKMMIYFMPVMIAIFTASVPAGVGVYWAASTLFGIGQQVVANRATITPNS